MIVGNIFNDNMDIVYTFGAMIKSSAYVISHRRYLFSTFLFRGEVVNFPHVFFVFQNFDLFHLTLRLLMSYVYGAPSKARNANVVYIYTYVWQR